MPLYDFSCPMCGIKYDIVARWDENEYPCECGEIMHKLPCAPYVHRDFTIMGEWDDVVAPEPVFFGSKQEKRQYLADEGLAIKGDTLKVSQKYEDKREKRLEAQKVTFGNSK